MSCLNLQRNSEIFFSTVQIVGNSTVATTDFTPANTWKVEVLAGFAATAGAATQDITSMESGLTPDRSQKRFNTAINPVDWNFQTYVRPTGNATRPLADWYLWQALMDDTSVATTQWSAGAIDSTNSNFATAQENYMYIKLDQLVYQVNKATVNQLTVDAGIEEIATATWTGFGTELVEITETADLTIFNTVFAAAGASTDTTATAKYHPFDIIDATGTDVTNAFIKNRLSTVTVTHGGATYPFAVTAMSFEYNNNITYLTPEELSNLNAPIGQFTGTRGVSGSLTMYLRGGTDESAQLLRNIYADSSTNSAATSSATINVGGSTGTYVTLAMSNVQFEFPQIAIEDNIAVSVNYVAQESDCAVADEVVVTAAKA